MLQGTRLLINKPQVMLTEGKKKISFSSILACPFHRKSKAIVIARLSSLSSCKNFNVACYSKSIKSIHTKHGMLAHHDKMDITIRLSVRDQLSW